MFMYNIWHLQQTCMQVLKNDSDFLSNNILYIFLILILLSSKNL